MAKNESTAMSFRLRDDARFILEQRADDWGISKTAVIERLLLATGSPSETSSHVPSTFTGRGLEDILEIQKRFNDLASIPGVSKGPKAEIKTGLRCNHCSERRFTGSKYMSICGECQEGGHRDTPANCKLCLEVQGAL